jgi:uncharacterized protein YbaR (Trm112 family)
MHILLTDRLACPRCGPEFGLVLLAHEVRDRRVLEGDLGCPNCREVYPVREGFADLRPPPRSPPGPGRSPVRRGWKGSAGGLRWPTRREEPAMPLIRLRRRSCGGRSPGRHGRAGHASPEGSRRPARESLGGAHRAGGGGGHGPGAPRSQRRRRRESAVLGRGRIPFYSGSFRGVVLSGDVGEMDVEEGCRVVAPLSRLVILGAGPEMTARVRALGLSVLLEQDGVLAAAREGPSPSPLIPLRGSQGPPTLP